MILKSQQFFIKFQNYFLPYFFQREFHLQQMLHAVNQPSNPQLVTEEFHKEQWTVAETLFGVERHVLTLASKTGRGGEWIWDLDIRYSLCH